MTFKRIDSRLIWLSMTLLLSAGLSAAVDLEASWSDEPLAQETTVSIPGQADLQPSGAVASSELTAYAEYFSIEPTPQKSGPVGFDLAGHEPTYLYLGEERVSYPQYKSLITGGANTLWIQGASAWAQYVMCPLGASVSLVATAPTSGWGTMYEIYPSGRTDKRNYWFSPYSQIYFYADEPGQHILLFVVNNRPSNAVIVDVAAGGWWPPGPGPVPGPGPGPVGMAKLTVVSTGLKGYDVVVDGIDVYSDWDDGRLDGIISFTLTGNRYHKIEISKGGYYYMKSRYFSAGRAYTIMVYA